MLNLALLLPLAATPLQAWRPVESAERLAAEFEPRLEALEQPGQVLRPSSGGLERQQWQEPVVEVPCTDPRGMGEVHELLTEPGGLVFIAAEHGLYVSHALAEATDRIEFIGAQLEPFERLPVHSLAADIDRDGRRRLFAICGDALLVIDPSFYWGAAWTADELPGEGVPRAVRIRDGVLGLLTSEGTYQLALGVHERPAAPRVVLETDSFKYGVPVDVALMSPNGWDALRHRLDMHHVWLESAEVLEGAALRLEPPRPGSHALDLVAVDDLLVRSEPTRLEFAVAYPSSLPKGLGLVLMLGVPLACFGVLVLIARRYLAGPKRALPRLLLGTAAIAVVGLQVLAGLFPQAKGWPFVGFSMYTGVWREGDLVFRESLGGIAPEGWSFDMRPFAPGGAIDNPRQVLNPLIEDGEPAAKAWARAAMAERPQLRLGGLQARARRTRLLSSGPVEIAPLILSHAAWGDELVGEDSK